ncbi:MAG TPA: diacylglycerol kinase family protein [Trueperaceae bacterium]
MIVNPAAGKRAAGENLATLEERLSEAGYRFEIRETTGEGDALEWARQASDVDLVVALGGDGTIMEVMSGLIDGKRGIPLAQIPAGTANLLARALGIPTDLDGAIDVALSGVVIEHDVGREEGSGRYFAMVAGAGFDAQLMEDTPRALKNRMGFSAYLIAGLRNLFRLKRSYILLQVDGDHHHFRAHTVMALNIAMIEGLKLPGAVEIDPHDGKLDIAIVTPASLFGILEVALRLVSGRLSGYERLRFMQARQLRIEANPPLDVELDGEPLGTTPLTLTAVRNGARFVVPRSYAQKRALDTYPIGNRQESKTSGRSPARTGPD